MSHHLGGVVLIKKIKNFTALWLLLICLEPSSKCSLVVSMGGNNLLYGALSIRIKDDSMRVFDMDLKAHNIRDLLLHRKEVEAPQSFTATDIACIKVLLHLILALAKLHSGSIMPLVDILVDILDGLD
jgi:hypothetical protein